MESYKMTDLILESIYDGGYFGNEFETMNVINFLRMFFDKYEFGEYVDTHNITESEYKRYFKEYIKQTKPHLHKMYKKIYTINRGGFIR